MEIQKWSKSQLKPRNIRENMKVKLMANWNFKLKNVLKFSYPIVKIWFHDFPGQMLFPVFYDFKQGSTPDITLQITL